MHRRHTVITQKLPYKNLERKIPLYCGRYFNLLGCRHSRYLQILSG